MEEAASELSDTAMDALDFTGIDVSSVVSKMKQAVFQDKAYAGWLPYVTGCDINDNQNDYAGIDTPIDGIEIYYYTPDSIRPYMRAKYCVAPVGGSYYPYQYDNETGSGQDGYAGDLKNRSGKFQMCIE